MFALVGPVPVAKVFAPETATSPFSVTAPVHRPFENAVQHSTELPGRPNIRPARGHEVVAETAAIVEVLRNDCVNYCINDCANYGINCCNTTPATTPRLRRQGGEGKAPLLLLARWKMLQQLMQEMVQYLMQYLTH